MVVNNGASLAMGRSPYGERGLKWHGWRASHPDYWSLSLRRAWIEISLMLDADGRIVSLSLRRAWIEITFASQSSRASAVALLTESVD